MANIGMIVGCRCRTLIASLLLVLIATACETAEPGRAPGSGVEHGRPDGIGAVVRGGALADDAAQALELRDFELAERAYLAGLETTALGVRSEWNNPASGHSGSLTPTRSYENAAGRVCREFLEALVIGGRRWKAYGAACRQPDGAWTLVR